MVRRWFVRIAIALTLVLGALSFLWPAVAWAFVVVAPLIGLGIYDCLQRSHAILRNFPVIGHLRYCLEMVRPEIQQYFIETNIDAHPIEREFRAVCYQRAKGELETRPFGTHRNVYAVGYEWASHSAAPRPPLEQPPRVRIGGASCDHPYEASLLNISAMSYGALSSRAVLALNRGARAGGFAHNTGEGGLSPYHLEPGGDLIWQIGTGYFGCRTTDGRFDPERFRDEASRDSVKMIEVKLSQGAKPGHGGVLPGCKVNEEIARIRGVPVGTTVISPPGHTAFDSPIGMLEFVERLRGLAGGKPVGVKLSVGRLVDLLAMGKAMAETKLAPDFVTVDGAEGGTGAAPLEFSNSLGMPARDAWVLVHNVLTGFGVRESVRLIASGKILTGFHMVRAMALGADLCLSARGMMFALGCIQSLRCNSGLCPTGVTSTDPTLIEGLVVADKAPRVERFHAATVASFLEILGAMGLEHPREVGPEHVFRRVDDLRVRRFSDIYDFLEPGQLLDERSVPNEMLSEWQAADARCWPGRAIGQAE